MKMTGVQRGFERAQREILKEKRENLFPHLQREELSLLVLVCGFPCTPHSEGGVPLFCLFSFINSILLGSKQGGEL